MTGKTSPAIGGIDLGATKILSVVVSDSGKLLAEDLRPTRGAEGPDAVIANMIASLRQAIASAGDARLAAIGIDAPGPIDYASGVVTSPPNLPGWHDVPLASIIGKEFGVPCVLENDGSAAAFAEHRWGSGCGSRHMLFLTVSSGVGGGIIIDGNLYRGASGAAGEVGHMTINARGARCHCGRRGCLEMYASGIAIARIARRLVARRPDSLLARMARKEELSAKLVHEAADQGDEGARDLIVRAGRDLGAGLGSLINVFNPQVIVLNGGLTKMGDLYLGPARETAQRESFEQSWSDVRIVVGELGDRAPALGAAAIALEAQRAASK
ncbi:MAG TPA: ROK family protein [Dehalococcoidia bacterium]|nr:ROK family protein [Dehalococcoidia bacterium]